ncbi:MAG: copper-binding protein [Brevundimonas sp.]|nr:copper-binding protein [Brevundimonas sp.]
MPDGPARITDGWRGWRLDAADRRRHDPQTARASSQPWTRRRRRSTINHEAIRSIGWPAMTMTFKASPAVLREAAVGDRIQFDLTVRDGAGEVTAIYPH